MNHKVVSLALVSILSLLTGCYANTVDLSEPSLLSDDNLVHLSTVDNREELLILKDGIYFAVESDYSDEGWKNTVLFNIEDGLMTTIEFNAINQNAKTDKRTLSQEGQDQDIIESLDNTPLNWHEQIEKLESYILNLQDFSNIQVTEEGKTDVIPNVTIEVNSFLQLINNALINGPIEKGNYQDGHYYAEQVTHADGYKYTINLIVDNGYIVGAHWDAVTEEGIVISEQQNNQNESWNEQAQLLENYLIKIQDPTLITFNEDNKTDAITGVTIEVNPFIQLAIEALSKGPIIN